MTSRIPQSIIDRPKKLERMADQGGGASENEIEMALAHIRKIRDDWDISEKEAFRESDSVKIVEEESREWNRLIPWMEMLAWVPADLFDCRWFIRNKFKGYNARGKPKYYKAITFVGTPRDTGMASELYQMLYQTIRVMGTMRFGGGNWNVSHTSYAEGVISTLRVRVRKLKENTDTVTPGSGAIVLVKGQALKTYMSGLRLSRGKALSRRSYDPIANSAGRQDGSKVDLTTSGQKIRSAGSQRRLPS